MRSSNAAVVLQTLVPQAREIFRLLAQAQLSGEAEEEGAEGALQYVFQAPTTAVIFTLYVGRTMDSSVWLAGPMLQEQQEPS